MKFNLGIDNINYIKIVYKDKNLFSHCVKAAVKRIDSKEIRACAKCEDELFIKAPQDIDLSIACEDGLYSSKTVLKYTEMDDGYVFFYIRTPDDINYKQDREFFRVRISEPATVYYLEEEKTIKSDAKIYDISANGVRLEFDDHQNFPEDVQIVLHFSRRDVHTLAKYIRNDEEDKIIKYSFNFVDLSVPDADYISQICIQKQLEQRKNKFL